uniref:MFS transporter n=1 Tax=Rhizomonospora bruguierae TaxID=1581705 RepID=UPI0035E41EA8
LPVLRLPRLPLLPPTASAGTARRRIWRRPGLGTPLLAAVSAGTWRGLLGSYIPVVLATAGHSTSTVGLLVGLGSATSIAGSVLVGLVSGRLLRLLCPAAALATGASLTGTGLWPAAVPVVAVLLLISGAGAGVLQTLSSFLAARSAPPDERGRVVAEVGTYRAVALLTSPLGIAALLLVWPLGPAMALVGATAAAPALNRWPGRVPAS